MLMVFIGALTNLLVGCIAFRKTVERAEYKKKIIYNTIYLGNGF
jgi:hypothetical protein